MTALGKLAGRWNDNNKENRKIEESPTDHIPSIWPAGLSEKKTQIIKGLSKEAIDAIADLVLIGDIYEAGLDKTNVGSWVPQPTYRDEEGLTRLAVVSTIVSISAHNAEDIPILKGD